MTHGMVAIRRGRKDKERLRAIEPAETLTSTLIEEAQSALALIDELLEAVDTKEQAPVESLARVDAALAGLRRLRKEGAL